MFFDTAELSARDLGAGESASGRLLEPLDEGLAFSSLEVQGFSFGILVPQRKHPHRRAEGTARRPTQPNPASEPRRHAGLLSRCPHSSRDLGSAAHWALPRWLRLTVAYRSLKSRRREASNPPRATDDAPLEEEMGHENVIGSVLVDTGQLLAVNCAVLCNKGLGRPARRSHGGCFRLATGPVLTLTYRASRQGSTPEHAALVTVLQDPAGKWHSGGFLSLA
jgi:hypothetical protein